MELIHVDKGRSERIRTRDQETECNISIPGFNRLFDTSRGKATKIIWLIMMVVCTAVCTYFTIEQLHTYFEYPTATKTYIERKDKIQFPPLSICTTTNKCYRDSPCEAVKQRYPHMYSNTSCDEIDTPLEEMNINLSQYWKECVSFASIDIKVQTTARKSRQNYKSVLFTETASAIGCCVSITHTEQTIFRSIVTSMYITLESRFGVEDLVFIPHGSTSPMTDTAYEMISHNAEIIHANSENQVKIHEGMFIQKNITGRECYDSNFHFDEISHQLLDHTNKSICRLPFLPENFPECQSLRDVVVATNESWENLLAMLYDNDLSARNLCNKTTYSVIVDYVIPNSTANESIATTRLIISFVDGTRTVISEYFSYTLPSLISDLFAYWGFFVCLSIPVIVEIVEAIVVRMWLCIQCFCGEKSNTVE